MLTFQTAIPAIDSRLAFSQDSRYLAIAGRDPYPFLEILDLAAGTMLPVPAASPRNRGQSGAGAGAAHPLRLDAPIEAARRAGLGAKHSDDEVPARERGGDRRTEQRRRP